MTDTVLDNARLMGSDGPRRGEESVSTLDGLKSRLRDLVGRLKATPSFKTLDRRLLEMQIESLKKKIQRDFGVRVGMGPLPPQIVPTAAQGGNDGQGADGVREAVDGISSHRDVGGTDQIHERAVEGMPGHATTVDQRNGVSGGAEIGKGRVISQGGEGLNIRQGIARLAILAGIVGAIVGWFHAQKVLRFVPTERYQHEVFETLMSSPVVKQNQSRLLSLKAAGIDLPGSTDVNDERIRAIFWKQDCSVDFFVMQDGGIVESEPSPSGWNYLLWVVFPVIGFVVGWGAFRGIGWAAVGFFQPQTS